MTSVTKARPPEVEGSPKATRFWHVDGEMLRFKIHFFLYIGALSAAIPFIVVFAKNRLGLAPSSLAAVLTSQMFLIIFTKPLIGYIADYFNKLKSIIVVLTLITGSGFFLLLAIPKFESEPSVTFNATLCHRYEDFLKFRDAENNISTGDINVMKIRTETETCQLCSQDRNCALNVTGVSSLNSKKLVNNSYDNRQQELNINNERIVAVVCHKNDSIIIRLCSCTGYSSSNNTSGEDSSSNNTSGEDSSSNNTSGEGSSSDIASSEYSSSNNTSKECAKIFCSNLLNIYERGDYLKIRTELNFSTLSQKLNQCSLRNNSTASELAINISPPKSISDFHTVQFWVFALLFSLSGICSNATFTLSDTACCESIQKTGADFGRQRLWGAVAWGLIAPIAGFLNDSTDDFLDSWLLMAAMLLLFLWNLYKLDLDKPNFSKNILGDVGTVLKSKEFLAYEVVIFMNGVSTGMIWFYLIWFLTSIGGSELLCGLCIAVQCFFGAIPFMFFSGWVIRKVGCFQILSAGLLTYVVRFLCYSYLYNPWWVLPIECCHGITYGLYYPVLAHYGKKSSKPGTEATTQSVIYGTHEGLGAGLGCVLAGIGFDYFGGHETFFAASMFCACGFIISLILFITITRQKRADEVSAGSQPHV